MDIMTLAAIAAMVLAQLADAFTTVRVLRHGGEELFRATRWLINRFGLTAGLGVKVVLSIAITVGLVWSEAIWMVWVGAAFISALAVKNWHWVK